MSIEEINHVLDYFKEHTSNAFNYKEAQDLMNGKELNTSSILDPKPYLVKNSQNI